MLGRDHGREPDSPACHGVCVVEAVFVATRVGHRPCSNAPAPKGQRTERFLQLTPRCGFEPHPFFASRRLRRFAQ
jgi:hypothetical protein